MQFQVSGVATTFASLADGSFFMFGFSEREYGIRVSDPRSKAAIMLSKPERPNGSVPWLATHNLPNAVVSFPSAVLRANHTDICEDTNTCGNLLSAAGTYYIRVSQSVGIDRTFNFETGQLDLIPQGAMVVAYSRWSIGVVRDGKFDPIFSFRGDR
jgi:hypothetical protein